MIIPNLEYIDRKTLVIDIENTFVVKIDLKNM